MPKRKSRTPEEWLKGQLRELQKENRNLKKRIRQLEKSEHLYEDVILGDRDAAMEEAVKEDTCSSCGKGKLKIINVLDKYIFEECSICEHRKKINGP